MVYTPDNWMMLKIGSIYKIFAVWRGGYTGSDEWRMNSGVKSVQQIDGGWVFEGYSGSSYYCYDYNYGTSFWGQGVLNNIIDKLDVRIEVLPANTDWSRTYGGV
jgi:hypothetical protein